MSDNLRPPEGDADPGEGRTAAATPEQEPTPVEERERRTRLERFGLAAVSVVMAGLFAVVAVAAVSNGEFFLAAMGLVGAMMTLVVGGITLLRG